MIDVVILGGGNIAYHLANKLLCVKRVHLIQVYNRNPNSIQYLDEKIALTSDISELMEADVYIMAVSDDAISDLSSKLDFKDKLVVHTSGSVAMSALKSNSKKGVFYPLQTFSKDRNIDFSVVPICIEAANEKDLNLLEKLARLISNNCYVMNSEQRRQLHLAAVFVNNFVNHLYQIGNEICIENKMPFEVLLPLIEETALKMKELSPVYAQTGPARRRDIKTIKRQKAMLSRSHNEIYTLLTNSIIKTYGKKL